MTMCRYCRLKRWLLRILLDALTIYSPVIFGSSTTITGSLKVTTISFSSTCTSVGKVPDPE